MRAVAGDSALGGKAGRYVPQILEDGMDVLASLLANNSSVKSPNY
jgi:hypothetical protein